MPTRTQPHRCHGTPSPGRSASSTGCPGRRPTALVDMAAAAEIIGTSTRHVRRLVFERRIPYVKVGHYVRFDIDELDQWIDDHRVAEAGCTHPRRR